MSAILRRSLLYCGNQAVGCWHAPCCSYRVSCWPCSPSSKGWSRSGASTLFYGQMVAGRFVIRLMSRLFLIKRTPRGTLHLRPIACGPWRNRMFAPAVEIDVVRELNGVFALLGTGTGNVLLLWWLDALLGRWRLWFGWYARFKIRHKNTF